MSKDDIMNKSKTGTIHGTVKDFSKKEITGRVTNQTEVKKEDKKNK